MIGINISDEFWEIIDELYADLPENQIVNSLYNFEVKRDEINYLSLLKEGDEVLVSYVPAKRVGDYQSKKPVDFYTGVPRQVCRIGKAMNKILIYPCKNDHLKIFVEQVQKYFIQNSYELHVVPPSDFKKYYLIDNYVPAINSELGKSCMRHAKCQNRFGIYEDNPNLKMAVALRRGKVAARGLIWEKVKIATKDEFADKSYYDDYSNSTALLDFKDSPELKVMDRVYGCNPSAKQFIINWAEKNCDLIHTTPKNPMNFRSADGKHTYNGLVLSQSFCKYKQLYYPYVDTFKYYDIAAERLTNSNQLMIKGGMMHFNDVEEGSFSRVTTSTPTYDEIVYELTNGQERVVKVMPF